MKHPLHPALVHFPVACWSLATLADLAGLWWPLGQLAAAMLVAGCAMGLLAAGAGLLEVLKLPPEHPAAADANRHMLAALSAWSLYATSLFLRAKGGVPMHPDAIAIASSVAGFIALAVTGWLGGKLVYVHGLGRAGTPD